MKTYSTYRFVSLLADVSKQLCGNAAGRIRVEFRPVAPQVVATNAGWMLIGVTLEPSPTVLQLETLVAERTDISGLSASTTSIALRHVAYSTPDHGDLPTRPWFGLMTGFANASILVIETYIVEGKGGDEVVDPFLPN
jgi:hypothetical protein